MAVKGVREMGQLMGELPDQRCLLQVEVGWGTSSMAVGLLP